MIYVASSWRNEYQPDVIKFLRSHQFNVYDFRAPEAGNHGFHWTEIDRTPLSEWPLDRYKQIIEHPLAIEGFDLDYNAMKNSSAAIIVLPCGRSAHLEAGYFVGSRKPLYVYVPGKFEPELMYKMATLITDKIGDIADELMAQGGF